MKFPPELAALVEAAREEHNDKVADSVEYGIALGTLVGVTAVTRKDNYTQAEEMQLEGFMLAHFEYLSNKFDLILGLDEAEIAASKKYIDQSAPVVMELVEAGMKEIVTITHQPRLQ